MTEPDNLPGMAKRLAKAFANNHLEHVGGAEADTLVKGTPNWHFFTRDAESAVALFSGDTAISRAAFAIQTKLCNMDEPGDRCALIATDAQAEQLARAAIGAL